MTQDFLPPSWRRPPGVSKGTWQYVHQRSIARHYQSFVADTPLCQLDAAFVRDHLRSRRAAAEDQKSDPTAGCVADFGCGNGRIARQIAREGWNVLAIDLSQPMLEEVVAESKRERTALENSALENSALKDSAPENAAPNAAGTVLPVRANLVELDAIGDAVADHAICMFSTLGMIQGHEARLRFLQHAARIVVPGGTLVLHVHRRWAAIRERGGWRKLLSNRLQSLYRTDVEFGDAVYSYRGLDNMFMHRFSASELCRAVQQAGWRVERIERVDLRGERMTTSTWDAGGFFFVCRKPTASTV